MRTPFFINFISLIVRILKNLIVKHTLLSVLLCTLMFSFASGQKITGDWPELSTLHAILVQSILTPEAKFVDANYNLVDDVAVRTIKLLKGNIPPDYRTGHVFTELQKLEAKGFELQKAYGQKLPLSQILPIEIEMHATLDKLLGNCGLPTPNIIQK